jgi:hypothetical protein
VYLAVCWGHLRMTSRSGSSFSSVKLVVRTAKVAGEKVRLLTGLNF